MPTGGSCDVAVFDGHGLTSLVEYSLPFRPNVGHRHVESVDTPVECVHKAREPRLQCLTLPPFFGTNPVRELCDDNGSRIAAVLLHFEPGDHPRIAVPLGRLANLVCIQQPTHSVRRRADARRRVGT